MRAAITEADKTRERLRRQHRANVEGCAPLLDKSIPLGIPSFVDWQKIRRYYAMKREPGQFFFHHVQGPIKQNVLRE